MYLVVLVLFTRPQMYVRVARSFLLGELMNFRLYYVEASMAFVRDLAWQSSCECTARKVLRMFFFSCVRVPVAKIGPCSRPWPTSHDTEHAVAAVSVPCFLLVHQAALSDVLLMNLWRSDLGRSVASNVRTIKVLCLRRSGMYPSKQQRRQKSSRVRRQQQASRARSTPTTRSAHPPHPSAHRTRPPRLVAALLATPLACSLISPGGALDRRSLTAHVCMWGCLHSIAVQQ